MFKQQISPCKNYENWRYRHPFLKEGRRYEIVFLFSPYTLMMKSVQCYHCYVARARITDLFCKQVFHILKGRALLVPFRPHE